ncbi:uncharacterized [Tachysurus ichikawai]
MSETAEGGGEAQSLSQGHGGGVKQNAPLQIQCITRLSCAEKKRGRVGGKGEDEAVVCMKLAREWQKDKRKVHFKHEQCREREQVRRGEE